MSYSSLLVMEEAAGEPTWFVPVSRQFGAAVRRVRGETCVRVSRDGAENGTSYIKLSALNQQVEAIAPAITRNSADRGERRVWMLPGGSERAMFVDVGRSTNEGRMSFTLMIEDDDSVMESGTEFLEMMDAAGLQGGLLSWEQFTTEEGWGLPALEEVVLQHSRTSLDPDDPTLEGIASAIESICGKRPISEEHLWETMVRRTEGHPHAISKGEFKVASQPVAELLKLCAMDYVDGFTAARTQLHGLLEKVLVRLSDDDLFAVAGRLAILRHQPDWELSSIFEATGTAICAHVRFTAEGRMPQPIRGSASVASSPVGLGTIFF
ncbi:MAG: hypothetical protein SGPRY_006824 [Prymnesium sp.]